MTAARMPAHAASSSPPAKAMVRPARRMSSGSAERSASPMVGFSYRCPKYQAGPANWIPKAPAQADSVCAELGLAWQRLSRRQIRKAPAALWPVRPAPAIQNSAAVRAGR